MSVSEHSSAVIRRASVAAAMCVFAASGIAGGQQTITPAMIAARGLPIRADTVDGLEGGKEAGNWFGFYVYAVSRATMGGKNVYLVTMNYASKEKGTFQSDTMALEASTLNPIWRRFHARTDSASVTFNGRHASGWSLQNDRHVTIDYELSEHAFAGPMLRWITAALPLAIGYQGTISVFNIWKNTEDKSVVNIAGSESVTAGTKSYDAWLLQSPSGARTWIDKASGRIVQVYTPNSRKGYWLIQR